MARFGLVRVLWAAAWPKMLPGSENLTPETRTAIGVTQARPRQIDNALAEGQGRLESNTLLRAAAHCPRLHPSKSSDVSDCRTSVRRTLELSKLRVGEALGFYLDHGRVHVGDLAATTEDAFHAWVSDRAAGLDTIMIAPTRHLVAELNRRARTHRLDHFPAGCEVPLADGNQASIGDMIITAPTTADSDSPPPSGSKTATAGRSPMSEYKAI